MKKIFLAIAVLFVSNSAHADFGLVGGLSYFNASSSPSVDTSAKAGTLIGLMYSSSLMIGPALEINVLYDNRQVAFAGVTTSLPEIQIPVILRFSLLPELLSFGAGAYYAFGIGSVSNDLGLSTSYSAAGFNSSDFGALGAVQVTLPIPGIAKLIAEGRYLFGLSNLSNIPGLTQHTREMELLLGIGITI